MPLSFRCCYHLLHTVSSYKVDAIHPPLPMRDLNEILSLARDAFVALRDARVFITGGTGFFGHWLVESLLHANRELHLNLNVTILTRSLSRFLESSPHLAENRVLRVLEGDIRSFRFPEETYTHILHAATDSGGAQMQRPPYELAESILTGTRRVLELGLATGAQRLLYLSSGAIYGRSSTVDTHISETSLAGPDPLLLQSSYDEAKRMSEHLCVAYTEGTDLSAVVARPFAFVGAHLPLDQHFAVGNFIAAAMKGGPIEIKGDGTPLRSWMYAADLAVWLWTMLLRGTPGRAYNVGSEDAWSIADAARVTAETLRPEGYNGSVLPVHIAGSPRPGAAMNSYVPSTYRARTELGLRQTIMLPEALRRTAAWHGYKVEGAS